MEESVVWQFDTCMKEMLGMKEVDVREYSPLTLAYIGDSIYDLIIKSVVVNEGNRGYCEGRQKNLRMMVKKPCIFHQKVVSYELRLYEVLIF